MAGRSTGVDDGNLDPGAVQAGIQLIQSHRSLAPADELRVGKAGERGVKAAKADGVAFGVC